MRIGIDVGGTHTDAVLLQGKQIIASTKAMTSADVISGVVAALEIILGNSGIKPDQVEAVMIGTTQFTNAVVERRQLAPVAAIRLALPSGSDIPPMTDWPQDIANTIGKQHYLLLGGYLYDGWPLAQTQASETEKVIRDIKAKGIRNIAIASAFSPMNAAPEWTLAKEIQAAIPGVTITLSHQMGKLGILERENACILNASLRPFADKVVDAFYGALKQHQLHCPMFVSQNDGTLMNGDFVRQYPALTFASGPTNSLRGASQLTGLQDAIVVDIGGTTSDIGFLQSGFPRESNNIIEVGGVRTNFRMPDIQAVALGGGSVISPDGTNIGPHSVGHALLQQAQVFGGDTLTATDIAVAAGGFELGDPRRVAHLAPDLVSRCLARMHSLLDQNIDMMKPNSDPMPVILVGGGSVLISGQLGTASDIIRPAHAGVANALGAAIAQIGGEAEHMLSYQNISRDQAIKQVTLQATKNAVNAGAAADSIKIADVEETAVPYMDAGSTRVRVKVIGDVAAIQPPAHQLTKETA